MSCFCTSYDASLKSFEKEGNRSEGQKENAPLGCSQVVYIKSKSSRKLCASS